VRDAWHVRQGKVRRVVKEALERWSQSRPDASIHAADLALTDVPGVPHRLELAHEPLTLVRVRVPASTRQGKVRRVVKEALERWSQSRPDASIRQLAAFAWAVRAT
jgi:FMN-dependent NADH-azoreductase